MDDYFEREIRDELSKDEKILWSGQPKQGMMLQPSDAFLIPFSLMWGGFAIFWESMVIISDAPCFFTLWGIPFVLVGLYMIIGRFFVDAMQREKTYYALTNERVIILSGLFGRNVRTLNLKTLSDININVKNNGSGTITFGPNHPMALWYSNSSWPGTRRHTAPTFEMIENVRQVYDTLREAQRKL